MSIHIELRNTEGFLDRFKSKGSAEKKQDGPKKTAAEKVNKAATSAAKVVGAAGQGLISGALHAKDNLKCELSLRELQKASDAKVPDVLTKVDAACGSAANKYCGKFRDAEKGRKEETLKIMEDSREASLCK